MEIIIAKSAGFCFGVNRAIETVYNELKKGKICTYGSIIHNKEVINDLQQKGVQIIEDIDNIEQGQTVIIRSHGVGPQIYKSLEQKNIKYVDCTCPFVKKIHNIVKKNYEMGNNIIIIGDRFHPEILGINSWCDNNGIIIEDEAQALNQNLQNKKYIVVSQTTFSKQGFNNIISILKSRNIDFELYNTICNATDERQSEAIEISKKVNIMLVIGDKKSSNTQKLYNICKQNCEKTYYIETIKDLQLNISRTNDKIGITAGASTPSAIIKEVIMTMNELNETNNENQSFEQMLDNSFVTLHTGDIVKGTVIRVTNEEVYVGLGSKSDGIIEKGEFSSDTHLKPSEVLKPGDELKVFVIRVNDGEGNVLLSRKRLESQQGLDEIEKAYETKEPIHGKFTEIVKGGMIALINGVRVFIPSSQVSNRYVEDLNAYLNKEFDFNIIEFNRNKHKIVGGRKELAEKEINLKKEKVFSNISIGQIVKGTVTRITDFGAFVDLGGIDGLIHISEMSWGRINKTQDILTEGQSVEVLVLDMNKEKGKISLSLKNPDNDPWKIAAQKYHIGEIVEGKVVRMLPFGVFVELEPGIDGLVHISQIANKHVVKPEDELKIGEAIKVKILDVNEENKKISLSKKEADGVEVESSDTTNNEGTSE